MPNESFDSVKVYYPRYSVEEIRDIIGRKRKELESLGVVRVVLFGSYAKNLQTAASDVDMLVLVRNVEHKEQNYAKIADCIGIDILELHLYTTEEFDKMLKSRSWLAKEVEKNGITLLDITKENT